MSIKPALSPTPSLDLIAGQVAAERSIMNGHAESLDTKAGVVLGFAGVLVVLGATAQPDAVNSITFRVGLGFAVAAGLLAVWAFMPRKYPVLEVGPLRQRYLTAPEIDTRLMLLDTQVQMVQKVAELVIHKGRRLRWALCSLATAVTLLVAGTLSATGGHHA